MSRLQLLCKACDTPVSGIQPLPFYNTTELSNDEWSRLEIIAPCGHVFHKEHKDYIGALTTRSFKSLNGKKETRAYQVEGLEFIRDTGFNCLVADQQGLGKTIEAILALREYPEHTLPALIIVKSATIWQWQREIKEWLSAMPDAVWMIRDGRGFIPPGFKIYLISMDTLRSYVKPTGHVIRIKTGTYQTTAKNEFEVSPILAALGIRTVIADEIHSFKNAESKRSAALVELCAILGIKNKIFLSGTPIMNRASEYFVPLNLLDPVNFPSMKSFKNRYLDASTTRIDPCSLEAFKAVTSNYIIRRERNQVLTELPKFSRIYEDVTIESDSLKKLYNLELDKMEAKGFDKDTGTLSYNDIKDNLMTMRRIIGLAKAEIIIDTIREFLESTESEKLVVGIHHKDVRDYLVSELSDLRPLSLSGEDSSDRKAQLIEAFKRPERRLMIVNIIAGGTGLNLQFCNNCIGLERQWNSATEEQFEDRFNRIGQTLPVTAAYPVVMNTIDQWFHQKVQNTREVFGETVACDFSNWMSAGDVSEMVDWATRNRL